MYRRPIINKSKPKPHLEEVAVELGGDGAREQGLARAGRAVEEATLRLDNFTNLINEHFFTCVCPSPFYNLWIVINKRANDRMNKGEK